MRLRADNASNRKQPSEPHQPRSRTPAKGERCPFGGPAPSEAPGSGDGPGLHRPPGYRGRPGRGSGRSALAGRRDGRGAGCPRRPARPCPAAALPQPPRPRRPPPPLTVLRPPSRGCGGREVRGALRGRGGRTRWGGPAARPRCLGPAHTSAATRPGSAGSRRRRRAGAVPSGSRLPPSAPPLTAPPGPAAPPAARVVGSGAASGVLFTSREREGICGASRRSKLFWTLVTQKASLQLIPLQ